MGRASARLDAVPVRLIALAATPIAGSFGPSSSETAPWRLSFHERGRAQLVTPDRVIALPPGRAILIGPDIGADAKAEGDAPQLLVEFELGRARDAAAIPSRDLPLVLAPDGLRDALARALLQELEAGAALAPSLCARAHALLHLCLSSALDGSGNERARARDERAQLQAALRYIDAHLADLLPNAKLAELAHASESHFIRMFRRAFGCTPARHVQERRISAAAELLLRSELSIDEIAERCGFANRYHFSRVFAQRMSQPPARFRALHASRSGPPSGVWSRMPGRMAVLDQPAEKSGDFGHNSGGDRHRLLEHVPRSIPTTVSPNATLREGDEGHAADHESRGR